MVICVLLYCCLVGFDYSIPGRDEYEAIISEYISSGDEAKYQLLSDAVQAYSDNRDFVAKVTLSQKLSLIILGFQLVVFMVEK